MPRIQVVVQCNLASLGFDEPRLHVDVDMRPSNSLSDWLQRRGRTARAWPEVRGDRPYQSVMIDRAAQIIKDKRTPCWVSGCGSGKSYMMCMLAKRAAAKGRRVGVVTVRRLLVKDLSDRFTRFGIPHSVVMAGIKDDGAPNKVASMHTLAARDCILDVDVLMFDESHTLLSTDFRAVIERHSHIPRVMMTASPCRADGQGLGRICDELVLGPSTEELIEQGFLVPSRIFTREIPDVSKIQQNASGEFSEPELEKVMCRPQIIGSVIKEWLYRAQNLPTIVHAVNLHHADLIVRRFQEAGVNAVKISGETPDADRKAAFDDMCTGSPSKSTSLLLDLAGNVAERFGRPEDPREWTLDDHDPKKPHAAVLSVRRCDKCWMTFAGHSPKCPECDNPYVSTVREIREKAAALVELKREQKQRGLEIYRSKADADAKIKKMAEFLKTAKDRNYARGWAWGRYNGLFKEKPTDEIIKAAYRILR